MIKQKVDRTEGLAQISVKRFQGNEEMMTSKGLVVAIDGPAGSGKTTVARKVAQGLGYTLVDTGALYRCVALAVAESSQKVQNNVAVAKIASEIEVEFERGGLSDRVWLWGKEVTKQIRTPQISQKASKISAIPELRKALLGIQRNMGAQGRVVFEGRDIGTVVFPEAEIKLFLDAAPEIRAKRRFIELERKGINDTYEETLAEVIQRDHRDRSRTVAPLRPADDATLIDTSHMSVDQIVESIIEMTKNVQATRDQES
jgi:cytidylate kinase